MPFNPASLEHLANLRSAVKDSREALQDAQRLRKEALERMVGKHYSTQALVEQQPTNLIELTANIYARNLAAGNPRAMITPIKRDLRASSSGFSLALNKHLEMTDLVNDLQVWVYESIFAPFGILKVYLDEEEYAELEGEIVVVGKPSVMPVLFDDWVHDMSARAPKEWAFCGHRYLVERESVIEHPLMDEEAKQSLTGSRDRPLSHNTDTDSSTLSHTKNSFHADYRDMVELWEIFLPHENLVLTLSGENDSAPPLRISEWTGPREGPYHFLYYTPVAGNTLPLPPVAMWRDLHDLANALFTKLGAQAERQKKILVVPGSQKEEADRINQTLDGQGCHVDQGTGQNIAEVSFGGIDAGNLNMFLQTWQLFDKHAGNISTLGGLGPMSGTVGQDRLLSEAASARVQAMQERVRSATKGVMQAVGFYLWHDPLAEIPIEYRAQGSSETMGALWSADSRQGDWYEYAIDIEPYSLQQKSPQEQLQVLLDLFDRLGQWLPVMEQQGILPNLEALIKLAAKLSNIPAVNDLWLFTQGEVVPTEEPQKMPSQTTRRYERVSRSAGMSDRGAANTMSQMLMGTPVSPQSNGAMVKNLSGA